MVNPRTRNFTLQEVVHTSLGEFPKELLPIAYYQLGRLQALREAANAYFKQDIPIKITSGYRSPSWNRAVGGVPTSHHIWKFNEDGTFVAANDIVPLNFSRQKYFDFLKEYTFGETYYHARFGFIHIATGANVQDKKWVQG